MRAHTCTYAPSKMSSTTDVPQGSKKRPADFIKEEDDDGDTEVPKGILSRVWGFLSTSARKKRKRQKLEVAPEAAASITPAFDLLDRSTNNTVRLESDVNLGPSSSSSRARNAVSTTTKSDFKYIRSPYRKDKKQQRQQRQRERNPYQQHPNSSSSARKRRHRSPMKDEDQGGGSPSIIFDSSLLNQIQPHRGSLVRKKPKFVVPVLESGNNHRNKVKEAGGDNIKPRNGHASSSRSGSMEQTAAAEGVSNLRSPIDTDGVHIIDTAKGIIAPQEQQQKRHRVSCSSSKKGSSTGEDYSGVRMKKSADDDEDGEQRSTEKKKGGVILYDFMPRRQDDYYGAYV